MKRNVATELLLDRQSREAYLADSGSESLVFRLMDLTLLKPDANQQSVSKHCEQAVVLGCRSACVSPIWLRNVSSLFANSFTKLCTVVGFPHGAQSESTKAFEAGEAVQNGATEIDFVQNIGLVKSQDWAALKCEYLALRKVTEETVLKVILETGLLNDHEIVLCTKLAVECGIDVVKTSTGYGPRGASVEDILIIAAEIQRLSEKSNVNCGIKASGGIRTKADFLKMVSAGATRIGTSSALSSSSTVGY